MSVAGIGMRVGEIQQLLAALDGVRTPASTPAATATGSSAAAAPTSFQSQLTAATTPAAPAGGGASAYDGLIAAAAQRHGLDPALLKGLIRAESNFDPNAGSPAGAQGLTQLMPATAASLGITDPRDPAQSIEGGATVLRRHLDAYGGDVAKALAAYNAGPGAVQRYGGVPPYAETQRYIPRVLGYAAEYRAAAPATAVSAAPLSATSSFAASAPFTASTPLSTPIVT